jgi:hypothetical protein
VWTYVSTSPALFVSSPIQPSMPPSHFRHDLSCQGLLDRKNLLLDPCSLFRSPSTFVPAWFVAQGCVHVEVCRNGIVTILPFITSNNTHIRIGAHIRTHTHTHTHTHT